MLKPQRIRYFVLSAAFSLMLLLGIGWMAGTAVASSENAATYREGQRGTDSSLASNNQAAQAAACSVETTGDNVTDFTTANATALQNAVDTVAAGTLIKVAGTCAGTQNMSGVVQTVYINKSLTIQGGYTTTNWLAVSNPTTNPTTLDALGTGRVVYIPSGNTTVVLDGLTIRGGNGFGSNGGGIIAGTNVIWTLKNSIVRNNSTTNRGGGIYNAATQFTMMNTTIRNNTAITMGGGLHSTGINSVATINTNSVIHNNSSSLDGGGIALDNGGTLNIANSTVRNNMASDDGGGIAVDSNTAKLNLTTVTLSQNTATDAGGGLYNNGILNFTGGTVTTNTAAEGGGFHNSSSGNATVTNVTFPQNQGTFGGGIYNVNGTVNATSITVSASTASQNGGGIWNDGTFNLTASTVTGNTATNGRGGGINNAAVMNITSSSVTQNIAPLNDGGGINNDGNLSIASTKVLTNSTTAQDGGGLHNSEVVTITTSTFANNSATDGGAIYMTGTGSKLTISSSTFNGNEASGDGSNRGGAIAVVEGALTLSNSTISGNSADNQGGGIWSQDSTTLTYATIVNNSGTAGAGIYKAAGSFGLSRSVIAYHASSDCASEAAAGNPTDNGYNLIEDNTCVTAGTSLSGNPLLNSSLANNGGSTKTHLPQIASPLIDKIPSGSCVLTVDQRNAARPVNVMCDIGSVEVQGANTPPTAVNDAYNVATNETLTVSVALGVLSNDTDINGNILTATLQTDVMSGTLVLNEDGSFVYTPDLDFCGTDSFTYVANDGTANSNVATVTITVACPNIAPVAVADEYTTDEDTTLNVAAPGVLDNDTDDNDDELTAVLDTNVMSGALTLNANGSFAYTPNANFCGTDSFVYHASDGQANSDMVTVTLNITCINKAPVAVNDFYSTAEGVTLNVSAPGVLGNDDDGDGDSLTAVLDDDVAVGTLTLNGDGSFAYVPPAAFTGLVTFTYHANDSQVDSNIATVTINVGAANEAPTAVNDSYSTPHNTALVVTAPGVLGNDTDPNNDSLTAVLNTGVSDGSLTLNPGGGFTYTPDNGFCGTDSFTYRANDGQASSNLATVSIQVACSNNLPVAVDDNYTTTEGILLDVAAPGVLANDSDADDDTLTAVLDTDVAVGNLTLNSDGSFVYNPPANFSGNVTFTYHVEAAGDSSNIATVTIVVEGDEGPPTFTVYLPAVMKPAP